MRHLDAINGEQDDPSNLPPSRYTLIEGSAIRRTLTTVISAIDCRTLQPVAIKSSNPGQPEVAERIILEAIIMSAFHHPHIVNVHGYGFDPPQAFFVMDYLPGGTIKEGIDSVERDHEVADTIDAFVCARVALFRALLASCDGLQHVHDQGVVHVDIKPSNIMLKKGVIIDFDLAMHRGVTYEDSVGTAHFMSPEQADGRPLDASTDVFGLAATLYTILTAKTPYDPDDAIIATMQAKGLDFRPIQEWERPVPEPLADFCESVLRAEQKKRPTALEFKKRMQELLGSSVK